MSSLEQLKKVFNHDSKQDSIYAKRFMVGRILDEYDGYNSYELFSSWVHNRLYDTGSLSNKYYEMLLRVKSTLPTISIDEISGEFLRQIIENESKWMDAWSKAYGDK